MLRQLFSVLFFCFCLTDFAIAQDIPAKKDSSKIYRSMETYAKKKGFTYALYKAFFRPVSDFSKKKRNHVKIYSYKAFEGKIIRSINISTHDPFGFNIYDTLQRPGNFWVKAGNTLHIKTAPFAIRNRLLFHVGDTLDELTIKESERILRLSPYLQDVVIYAVNAGNDSADIYIREIDLWTTIIRISSAGNDTKIQLIERDFFGTGHSLDNSVQLVPHNNNIYEGIYIIPDFKNTFISTTLFYKSDFDSIYYNGISINRPFYSPLAKWAGGIAFSNTNTSDTLFYTDVIKTIPDVKYNQYDVWAGKSWPLFKGNTELSRRTSIILTARYLNTDFLSNPLTGSDTLGLLTDEKFYLAGLGISQRIYVKDSYIFKFGLPEDVPTGQIMSFTIGRQNKGTINRTYIGTRVGWGNYTANAGYFAVNFEYGTFKNSSHLEQGVFSADVIYFTKLLEIGKWKLRQFVKPRLMIGFQRFPSDVLTINDQNGIQGFNTSVLYGTRRLVFSTQSQLYAPYSIIGFRFAPILYLTGALLPADGQSFFKSRFYSSIGFGILIRNEYLVLNTFQISIAYYPVIPGFSNNLLKVNSIKSSDFQFRDFDMQRPATIPFQ